MLKKLFLILFMFITILIIKTNTSKISQVFNQLEDKTVELDNQYKEYHIYYDNINLTTSNILNELSFLEHQNNIKIILITDIAGEDIEYSIDSSNLSKKLGDFFNYCISILESKYLDKEVESAYSNGIKINKMIITMPKVLANNYLQYKDNLQYEIK